MGIGIALGIGSLSTVALAIWLVLSYRRLAELEQVLALAQIDEADLRGKLAGVTDAYQHAVAEAKEQAARDAAHIASVQAELDKAIEASVAANTAPADMAAALSRKKPTP